ncbi:MAG TPA: M23 family metallopeptidase [Gemmatimonadales bacterium]|nr:M23 family metallopeptidase [Gemmatimonadales bacterium]
MRRTLTALGLLPVIAAAAHGAQQAVVSAVDLLVPVAPVIVAIEGRAHLVHELHLTNFAPGEVTLRRVQVLLDGAAPRALADYGGADLDPLIGRPGLPRDYDRPRVVGPGMRAIVHFWMELPAGMTPTALRHRVEFDLARPGGAVALTVESGPVPLSATQPVVLGPPLRGGLWVAAYDPVLRGGHRTVAYAVDGRARIPGRFAIDWVRLPPGGRFDLATAAGTADWNGYGSEVLAVADAVVAATRDDVPDNRGASPDAPVALENASGNYVALDLGDGQFAVYEHLQRGSVAVRPGQRVRRGQVIGRLGNSGSSSIGPHLHFHVGDAAAPVAAEGLPFVFAEFEQAGRFASITAMVEGERWRAADGQPAVRRRERPAPMAVVRFR